METQNKTSSDILSQAANLLEYEIKEWGKGSYFKHTDQGCSMCAHGAIAYCGDPEVKKRVDNKMSSGARTGAEPDSSTVYYANYLAKQENLSLEQYLGKHYGEVGLAHYKAGQVGLTVGYNDAPKTTKEDVIKKLREAASIQLKH